MPTAKLTHSPPDHVAVQFGAVYERERTTGADRLRIAADANAVDLLLALAATWSGDIGVLYVLLVPRQGNREPGRYQSAAPMSFGEASEFLCTFRDFFESDGRHHVWLCSVAGAGTLVYDHHNWIYAYGDLSAYERILAQRGFRSGPITLPVPHTHNYHAANDQAEEELMSAIEWRHFPLGPDDE